MYKKLQGFALNQLNWILGLNPYEAFMLQGSGHNNPAYGFFGTFEYTNAPGGIVNGITSGLDNENDIDFNVSYAKTAKITTGGGQNNGCHTHPVIYWLLR